MAWYPGAPRMELQPESDAQPAICPTQFIVHSIVAPWTPRRLYEYWDRSTLESHFGIGYAGDLAQYIGTETRADTNYQANRRADGTGAVSVETASNTSASDPWTDAQVEELIRLGVWMHEHHGLPLRICRTHDDPGYGYHSLHPQWSKSGTACPGKARITQFHQVVFPGIVARATSTIKEDNMALSSEEIYDAVWRRDIVPVPGDYAKKDTNPTWWAETMLRDTNTKVRALTTAVTELAAQGAARDAVLAKLAAGDGLDSAEIQAAAEAGAQAALDRLADALSDPTPTRKDDQT